MMIKWIKRGNCRFFFNFVTDSSSLQHNWLNFNLKNFRTRATLALITFMLINIFWHPPYIFLEARDNFFSVDGVSPLTHHFTAQSLLKLDQPDIERPFR